VNPIIARYWEKRAREAADPRSTTLARLPETWVRLGVRSSQAWTWAWLERLAPGRRHALDLGCGNGDWTLPLSRRFAHVTAVDACEGFVRHVRRRCAQAHLSNVTCRRADLVTDDLGVGVGVGVGVDLDLDPSASPASGGEAHPRAGDLAHPRPGDEPHPRPGDEPHPRPGDEPHPRPGDEPHPRPGDEPHPRADVAVLGAVSQYLTDEELSAVLSRLRAWVRPDAVVYLRTTVPFLRERLDNCPAGYAAYYRSPRWHRRAFAAAGLRIRAEAAGHRSISRGVLSQLLPVAPLGAPAGALAWPLGQAIRGLFLSELVQPWAWVLQPV
jgi:SAM-dependent methyltransferase